MVGIGASAGGLEAFIDLISAMPADRRLTFALVQHLDPIHHGMLVDILTRATAMPVQQVTDRMRVERDHLHVIPSDAPRTIEGKVLRLAARTPEVPHRPLDRFSESLALDRGKAAIGVMLSGNDADGAEGLKTESRAHELRRRDFDVPPPYIVTGHV